MANWTRQPQERGGTYMFSGQLYTTRGVSAELLLEEVLCIYSDVKAFAEANNGADYLQVYTDENGRKLFFIDQLSKEMIESDEFNNEDNHCTLMFASEY